MLRFLGLGVLVLVGVFVCVGIIRTSQENSDDVSVKAASSDDAAVTNNALPDAADLAEEQQMQEWLRRHKNADHDDAEAAEEVATFRWSTKGRVRLGGSVRTVDGVYCLDYTIAGGRTPGNWHAYILRDPNFNNSMWMSAESDMISDSRAMAEWRSAWDAKCTTSMVAKNTTSYLSKDLIPPTDEFK